MTPQGEGSMADYFNVLGGSWQQLVSQFLAQNIFPVVDSARGIICITFDIVLHIDGRGKVGGLPL